MALQRKDILLITNKEKAFHEIQMKTDWSNHRKAAERASWRKKHEPDKIQKCPNRGKRHKKKETVPEPVPAPPQQTKEEEIKDDLCFYCKQPSEGYDFPCSHPICHPCFIRLFHENNGHMVCQVCQKEYDFIDNIVDEND